MADSILDIGSITAMWLWQPNWARYRTSNLQLSKTILAHYGTSYELWVENLKAPRRMEFTFLVNGREDAHEIISFISDRKGRFEKFWIPTWIEQFRIAKDIWSGEAQITVADDSFSAIFSGYERVALILYNGDIIVRRITAVTVVGSTEVISLASPLDRNILMTDINFICLFLLGRFDSDLFVLDYESSLVSQIKFSVYELIREYPA